MLTLASLTSNFRALGMTHGDTIFTDSTVSAKVERRSKNAIAKGDSHLKDDCHLDSAL